MKRLAEPQLQARMRRKAAVIAESLSDRGVVDWLRESIERGEPRDSRFEDLFACPARAATPARQ
jgi:glutamate-1-semialdehyde 2,1-aminomutase